jgi:hypothetical protein
MPITYNLRDNKLTVEENDYMAHVISSRQVELDEVIERMMERGSTVTKADILSVMEDFQSSLEGLLSEGVNVKTPFANFSTSIKGVFNGATDSFDKTRHQIMSNLNPGKRLRAFYRNGIPTQKDEAITKEPKPVDYIDNNSGERNTIITPGGMATLIGNRLNFDPADAAQGVFYIGADGTEVRVEIVGQNKPSQLMFVTPVTLTSGDYSIEIRNKPGNNIRVGRLIYELSVA